MENNTSIQISDNVWRLLAITIIRRKREDIIYGDKEKTSENRFFQRI